MRRTRGWPANRPRPSAITIVATAADQTVDRFWRWRQFCFQLRRHRHATVTNFNPATDTLQFSGSIFADVQAALNATHDDGHGNTIVSIDAHDIITLSGVPKAQLHGGDFHVV